VDPDDLVKVIDTLIDRGLAVFLAFGRYGFVLFSFASE
jgi:hypothetical protein